MKEKRFDVKIIVVISALALFNFLFLGTEYLFDNMMAFVTDSKGVVVAQSYILGVSVIGFLLFPFIKSRIKKNFTYRLFFNDLNLD